MIQGNSCIKEKITQCVDSITSVSNIAYPEGVVGKGLLWRRLDAVLSLVIGEQLLRAPLGTCGGLPLLLEVAAPSLQLGRRVGEAVEIPGRLLGDGLD